MLARALVGGLVLWIYSSVCYTFGCWWATRHKEEDQRAIYFRGYSDGWCARSNEVGEDG
jgi:hypothetical protein